MRWGGGECAALEEIKVHWETNLKTPFFTEHLSQLLERPFTFAMNIKQSKGDGFSLFGLMVRESIKCEEQI